MAYGYGSTHSSSANLVVYIIRRMLKPLRNKLRMAPYATKASLPVRAGTKVARWILPVDIGVNTTAIAEFASAPEVATLTWSTYEATVSTYGHHSKMSDLADSTWLPQAKNAVADAFGYGASKTIDTLIRNDADDTGNFIVSGQTSASTGTLTTSDTMTAQDVAVVGGYFDENDCEGFDSVGGDYVLICHGTPIKHMSTHVEPGGATTGVKIEWTNVNKYTDSGRRKLERYEQGTFAGVSVQRSNNVGTTTLTNTVTAYVNLGFSQDAVGRVNLDMNNFRVIMKNSGPQDTSNPLNLFGTIGWKARLGHRGLDTTRGVKLYTAI